MKNFYLCLIFSCTSFCSFAQIGINTTNPESALDIASNDEGILIPRVSLTDLYTQAPITNPSGASALADGTLVYNTNNVNNVNEGFYFWDNSRWNSLVSNANKLNFCSLALPTPSGVNNDLDILLSTTNADRTVFRITHAGADIGGIIDGVHGNVIYIYNGDTSDDLKLLADGNSTSTATTRFSLENDLVLKPGSSTIVFYDQLYLQRWIVVKGS